MRGIHRRVTGFCAAWAAILRERLAGRWFSAQGEVIAAKRPSFRWLRICEYPPKRLLGREFHQLIKKAGRTPLNFRSSEEFASSAVLCVLRDPLANFAVKIF